jgi:hypothetical protein
MFLKKLGISLSVSMALFSYSANASQGFLETGDVLETGNHKAQVGLLGATSGDTGLDFMARFATPIHRDAEVQAELGAGGSSDIFAGAYIKYVPFPDFGRQPAVGVRAGYGFTQYSGDSVSAFQLQPLASKLWTTDIGEFTPYFGLPMSITSRDGESYIPMQAVIGSSFKPNQLDKVNFKLEYGMNVIRSFNYIGLSAEVLFSNDRFAIE